MIVVDPIIPKPSEAETRERVVNAVLEQVELGRPILLPPFDPATDRPNDETALLRLGYEQNPYRGTVGAFTYQFEGEEDLLHIVVTHKDLEPLQPEEAQSVVAFLLPGLPAGLVWIKPGTKSHHFYLGHEVVLAAIKQTSNNAEPQSGP